MLPACGPAELPVDAVARRERIWRSPLVVLALAVTAGIVCDRLIDVTFPFALLVAGCGLGGFVLTRSTGLRNALAVVYLGVAAAGLGAAYHHYRRDLCRADDIGFLADQRPRPARVRGVLAEEPRRQAASTDDPLRPLPAEPSATAVLTVRGVADGRGLRAASGRVRLFVSGSPRPGALELLDGLHAGDEIEVHGRLLAPAGPNNPGELDTSASRGDRGVRAVLRVRHGDGNDAVRLLRRGWLRSPRGWIGALRTRAHRLLDERLGESSRPAALARALLLGEGAPMTGDDWGKYVRTGVVHVLAISGQHLVVVAAFLWFAAHLVGLRQRRASVTVAALLLGYALLTGGRPPALRAAVAACAVCLGLTQHRPVLPGSVFALGWLVVAVVHPVELFEAGTQLSFLSVAVLCWGTSWLLDRPDDPLARLIDEARPAWLRLLIWLGRLLLEIYTISFIVWLAVLPLVVYHTGLLPTAGPLLGPPLTLLTSVALLFGFLLLLVGGWAGPLAAPLAWPVVACLQACEWLVDLADARACHLAPGSLAIGWVVVFYLGLIAVLTEPALRRRWRWLAPLAPAWLCLVLLHGVAVPPTGELRCTFLAVGHGGCVVVELPDGRTVLYDAGSMRGPEVAARTLIPFLHARGVRRLDEVVLSHADLDHFNGLTTLVGRFAVGRVLSGETFATGSSRALRYTLTELDRQRVRRETVARGDRLITGDVTLDVLHPPAGFYRGDDNARSLVVQLRHGPSTVLLTGDLEGEGLAELLRQLPVRIDVLQVPHHGSARVDHAALAGWCRPRLVVSCQDTPRGAGSAAAVYRASGADWWSTHERGAVTVRSQRGLTVEAFHRRLRLGD